MQDSKLRVYLVKRRDDGWMFVPSIIFASLMIGAFGAGAAFLVYLSTIFFRSGNSWFGAIFILVACLPAGLGTRAWLTRRTPLKVEPGGRVSYGERELCAAGSVQSVRIVPSHSGESGDCEVRIELADGKLVSIPSQYFAVFKSVEHARPFAGELAKALGVPVKEFG
jgi:hypothetical protein